MIVRPGLSARTHCCLHLRIFESPTNNNRHFPHENEHFQPINFIRRDGHIRKGVNHECKSNTALRVNRGNRSL